MTGTGDLPPHGRLGRRASNGARLVEIDGRVRGPARPVWRPTAVRRHTDADAARLADCFEHGRRYYTARLAILRAARALEDAVRALRADADAERSRHRAVLAAADGLIAAGVAPFQSLEFERSANATAALADAAEFAAHAHRARALGASFDRGRDLWPAWETALAAFERAQHDDAEQHLLLTRAEHDDRAVCRREGRPWQRRTPSTWDEWLDVARARIATAAWFEGLHAIHDAASTARDPRSWREVWFVVVGDGLAMFARRTLATAAGGGTSDAVDKARKRATWWSRRNQGGAAVVGYGLGLLPVPPA